MTAVPGPVGHWRQPEAARRHRHLWSLPDGTGLHAPPGRLLVEEGTGRLCCHLCGEWFASLGIHVRVHGHTAGSYRAAMSLPRATVLAASQPTRRGGRVGYPRSIPRAGADVAGQRGRMPERRDMDLRMGHRDASAPGDPGCGPEQRSAGWAIIVRRPSERQNGDWLRVLPYWASAL